MSKFIHDLFTGKDNDTFDIGRVLWFQCVNAYIVISLILVWRGTEVDLIALGGGLAALLGAGGAALGLKSNAEPDKSDKRRDHD